MKEFEELRLYSFQNMYLHGVHCGPQGIHSVANMFIKYRRRATIELCILDEWATTDKTVIVVNGGYSSHLQDLSNFLSTNKFGFPWASFRESEEALNRALTNVCVVLPKSIWGFDLSNEETKNDIIDSELELITRIQRCRLMN